MVDAERLRRVLQRVSDDLAALRDYAAQDRATLHEPARLGHLKYLFVTAIEGCIDAAHHTAASEGWGPPDNNAHAMALLTDHGVIDAATATAMAKVVRFRNLLVHGYARVDDEQVLDALARINDLETYVAELTRLLD